MDSSMIDILKKQMDCYKNNLTDKYNRAHSHSKQKMLARELMDFSYIYRELFGNDCKFEWDDDVKIYGNFDIQEYNELITFVNSINENNEFYYDLSSSIINSYIEVNYPFYKYFSGGVLNRTKLDSITMLGLMFSFLKGYNYDVFLEFKDKFINLELLEFEFDNLVSGAAFPFFSFKKSFILLNKFLKNNLYKYETVMHEFGHIMEMQLFQKSNNSILLEKGLETPYSEVSSCFFEYAFLNYLKENKIYTEYVNRCLDNYFKELLSWHFYINIISKFPNLEIEEDGTMVFDYKNVIKYGDSIKDRLNYYSFEDYNNPVVFKQPYLYGIGQLFSIYLYENYKENPDFYNEFNKTLLMYPFENNLSVFNRFGINEDALIQGDVFKKILKRHCISLDKNN